MLRHLRILLFAAVNNIEAFKLVFYSNFTNMDTRSLFLHQLAQTSPSPLAIEIVKAEGCYLYEAGGKKFLDLIGGISVANTGHRHPNVVEAIKQQADAYLHIMVYGETIQSPQVRYAQWLIQHLPPSLNSVYFTNSGAEAAEGAMKLAKRVTGRYEIMAFNNSYHGSTQGALSILGDEYWRQAYRPLLPAIVHAGYNTETALQQINSNTACVVMEVIQAEKGVHKADVQWLKNIRTRCTETGTLLVFDEVQTGFGRTGSLWAFEHYGVVPDILMLGKALGGGMPLGAFIADKKLMDCFTANPVLGHITTFGGHPVSCAAGLAAANVLEEEKMRATVEEKKALFLSLLKHPLIKKVNAEGLLLAVVFEDADTCLKVVNHCLKEYLFTDWFLFAPECLRIAPPLMISEAEIKTACNTILGACAAI
jgi:acetylornithine/N-succinyldiaminopimelate aminotransferase